MNKQIFALAALALASLACDKTPEPQKATVDASTAASTASITPPPASSSPPPPPPPKPSASVVVDAGPPNCTPPIYMDEQGHEQFKPNCLPTRHPPVPPAPKPR